MHMKILVSQLFMKNRMRCQFSFHLTQIFFFYLPLIRADGNVVFDIVQMSQAVVRVSSRMFYTVCIHNNLKFFSFLDFKGQR